MLAINSQLERHYVGQINLSVGWCQPRAPFGDAAGSEEWTNRWPGLRREGVWGVACITHPAKGRSGAEVQWERQLPSHVTSVTLYPARG